MTQRNSPERASMLAKRRFNQMLRVRRFTPVFKTKVQGFRTKGDTDKSVVPHPTLPEMKLHFTKGLRPMTAYEKGQATK